MKSAIAFPSLASTLLSHLSTIIQSASSKDDWLLEVLRKLISLHFAKQTYSGRWQNATWNAKYAEQKETEIKDQKSTPYANFCALLALDIIDTTGKKDYKPKEGGQNYGKKVCNIIN